MDRDQNQNGSFFWLRVASVSIYILRIISTVTVIAVAVYLSLLFASYFYSNGGPWARVDSNRYYEFFLPLLYPFLGLGIIAITEFAVLKIRRNLYDQTYIEISDIINLSKSYRLVLFLRNFPVDHQFRPDTTPGGFSFFGESIFFKLRSAILPEMIALRIGEGEIRDYAGGSIVVKNDEWFDVFRKLCRASEVIVVIPSSISTSGGLLDELFEVFSQGHDGKCILISPIDNEQRSAEIGWNESVVKLQAKGLEIPTYPGPNRVVFQSHSRWISLSGTHGRSWSTRSSIRSLMLEKSVSSSYILDAFLFTVYTILPFFISTLMSLLIVSIFEYKESNLTSFATLFMLAFLPCRLFISSKYCSRRFAVSHFGGVFLTLCPLFVILLLFMITNATEIISGIYGRIIQYLQIFGNKTTTLLEALEFLEMLLFPSYFHLVMSAFAGVFVLAFFAMLIWSVRWTYCK